MLFNFPLFSKIAATAYPEKCLYSLEECLSVFRYYFQTYEDYFSRPHPHIRREQIARIMRDMPEVSIEDRGGIVDYIYPDEYPALIDRHFETEYYNCDYNINHFFSGRIREIRIYEEEKDL